VVVTGERWSSEKAAQGSFINYVTSKRGGYPEESHALFPREGNSWREELQKVIIVGYVVYGRPLAVASSIDRG